MKNYMLSLTLLLSVFTAQATHQYTQYNGHVHACTDECDGTCRKK